MAAPAFSEASHLGMPLDYVLLGGLVCIFNRNNGRLTGWKNPVALRGSAWGLQVMCDRFFTTQWMEVVWHLVTHYSVLIKFDLTSVM